MSIFKKDSSMWIQFLGKIHRLILRGLFMTLLAKLSFKSIISLERIRYPLLNIR